MGINCSQPPFTAVILGLRAQDVLENVTFHGKAYNTRVVVAWCATVCHVAAQAAGATSRHALLRSACLHFLAEFFLNMEIFPRFLEVAQAKTLALMLDSTVKACAELGEEAAQQGQLAWHILPKFHQMSHLSELIKSELYNPRFYHTFTDESVMGLLKRRRPNSCSCAVFAFESRCLSQT